MTIESRPVTPGQGPEMLFAQQIVAALEGQRVPEADRERYISQGEGRVDALRRFDETGLHLSLQTEALGQILVSPDVSPGTKAEVIELFGNTYGVITPAQIQRLVGQTEAMESPVLRRVLNEYFIFQRIYSGRG